MSITFDRLITHLPTAALGSPPWPAPRALPSQPLPPHADVLVVGAGITGLSAGIGLAERGHDVTVIERQFGSGASARNGGIVLGDTLVGPDPAFLNCDLTLRGWIADTGADCDAFWCGCLELARDAALPSQPIDWQDAGPVRKAGAVSGGVLNPIKLIQALADAARRAGVTIVDRVNVHGLASNGAEPSVLTDRGEIRAADVVMAVDATARMATFDPWSERMITVALRTAPLTSFALAAVGLEPHQAFYTSDLPLLWGRVMPDRSLLVGRETIAFPREDARDVLDRFGSAVAQLTSRVRGLHPSLRDADVVGAWSGPIARANHGLPGFVSDPDRPRVLWAGGYGGHGIAQAFRMGTIVAEKVNQFRKLGTAS